MIQGSNYCHLECFGNYKVWTNKHVHRQPCWRGPGKRKQMVYSWFLL